MLLGSNNLRINVGVHLNVFGLDDINRPTPPKKILSPIPSHGRLNVCVRKIIFEYRPSNFVFPAC